MVADRTDLGMKVVVEHRYWGLIYQDDMTQPLRRGQTLKGYVKQRREDGRVDISLLPPGRLASMWWVTRYCKRCAKAAATCHWVIKAMPTPSRRALG